MKKRLTVMLVACFVASLPLVAVSMEHKEHDHSSHSGMDHKDMEQMDHKGMEHMEHGGMAMQGDMMMLGDQVEDGVKAMAHLKDVKESMSKMGMSETHHFMVMFVDVASGEPIEQGVAAVKIVDPSGNTSEPVALMGMQGHFGADVALSPQGEYVFKLGTKLADGKKRQFEFNFTQQ
jgi:hypothetical protein